MEFLKAPAHRLNVKLAAYAANFARDGGMHAEGLEIRSKS
jgi:hypothetical protein